MRLTARETVEKAQKELEELNRAWEEANNAVKKVSAERKLFYKEQGDLEFLGFFSHGGAASRSRGSGRGLQKTEAEISDIVRKLNKSCRQEWGTVLMSPMEMYGPTSIHHSYIVRTEPRYDSDYPKETVREPSLRTTQV
jgi:hypothetical protein